MNIQALGVDLGKHGCHIVGQDTKGNLIERKQLTNRKFAVYLAKLPPCAAGSCAAGSGLAFCLSAQCKTWPPRPCYPNQEID